MKVYVVPGSPNCRKVQAVVHELGISIESEVLDFSVGAHKSPQYLGINPNGLVPSLVDGELRLWESNAIMQYLCDVQGSELFPRDLARRADVVRWQCWELAHFGRHLGAVLLERLFKPLMGAAPNEPAATRALEAWRPFAKILERQLEQRPFVTGDAISLADYSLAPQLASAHLARVDLAPYPATRTWLARLDSRQAWSDTAPPQQMLQAIEQAVARYR